MKGDFSGDPYADTGRGGERVALYVIDAEHKQRELMRAPETRVGFVASPIESLQRFGEGMWVGQVSLLAVVSIGGVVLSDSARSRSVTPAYFLDWDGGHWRGLCRCS